MFFYLGWEGNECKVSENRFINIIGFMLFFLLWLELIRFFVI